LNAWPRCELHRTQWISVRIMPWLMSRSVPIFSAATGWKKLGQPVPESNFTFERNNGSPQPMQA
jgi:hypothetical protein